VLCALKASASRCGLRESETGELNPQKTHVVDTKLPISERKLQANRANAKRSTGPKTEAGKAASRRNALKHGITSCSTDLPVAGPGLDLRSVKLNGSLVSEVLGANSALQEINRIWCKLARVVAFENGCARRPAGLVRNARLIWRYERMLTKQLHERIRECAGLERNNLESSRGSL
jgi:hypothetical protein